MSAKDSIKATMQAHADASGDLQLRVALGRIGARILVDGETETCGVAYTAPGFLDTELHGVGVYLDASGLRTEDFLFSTGAGTSITLSQTPQGTAYVVASRSGILMRPVLVLGSSLNEYTLSGKVVGFNASGVADVYYFQYRY